MNRTTAQKIIRQLQAIQDFGQAQMARNLGVSERTFRNYLNDPATMNASTWWKIENMARKQGIMKEEAR